MSGNGNGNGGCTGPGAPGAATLPEGLIAGPDGLPRCAWGCSTMDYVAYHDNEWGFPQGDDLRLFEKLCLEGFQSGLSWLTILRKRESFRAAFAGFDYRVLAEWGPGRIEELLLDASIVRHRGKIASVLNNARRTCELVDEHGSLAAYLWSWEPTPAERPAAVTWPVLRTLAKTPQSTALSKDLKRRGFSFVGPTTMYAMMQAMGLVDDHVEGCCVRAAAERARASFVRPGRVRAAGGPPGEAPDR